jgi:hypothetical protein
VLALPQLGVDDGAIDASEIERRGVSLHLSVEWRIAIDECEGEAELLGEEVARRFDVGDEQLRLGGGEDGSGQGSICA